MKKTEVMEVLFGLSRKFAQKEATCLRAGNLKEAEVNRQIRIALVEEALDLDVTKAVNEWEYGIAEDGKDEM